MFLEKYKDKATFVLRLFLGVAFIVAGLDKLTHLSGATGMFEGFFGGAGAVMLWLALIIEIVGGTFLLIGYQTRYTASVLAILILVAFIMTFNIGGMDFISQLREIMVMNTGGGNTAVNFAYFAGLLSLAFSGSESLAVKPE
ncbi:DoxX family protein [Nanoarchaeota archaeon]